MRTGYRRLLGAGIFAALPLCLLLAAGCSKPEETSGGSNTGPAQGPPGGPGGPGGGPGGRMRGGGPGGPGGPVAENATGAEIYQAKCNCHGPGGKGGRAPVLTGVSSRADSELFKIIHDGRQKMPAFGTQLSEAQINKVVAYLKELKP
jgi:hypothetical protein